ncbi:MULTISPECIES: pyridoxamine 5'-phosphate oxidase family protein [Microbacterium]|uniref:pyridoxamine 5'-phosphate oxidase family protein n=1 Tax=Microbacterium TaxID=33882 RepID=UPI00217E1007|nr:MULTISPECIES: pyridoxamine 5'-phosphate oxidase family protein [Microbacterium]UWF77937.1 pyridoxamine 5'-phosphate oxidase family protein [Microbacterium neungamense]WCM56114.1 pyridoxamine 5'-phosphate oxidase family protein [Microbacterium sp. EF45047]
MITELSEQQCIELLGTTTVGRLGFVHEGRVHVIPVNFLLDGHDIVVRTSPEGPISELPDSTELVAFEIDHHDDLSGGGWSVLLNGPVTVMSDEELAAVPGTRRVQPWAGGERSLALRLRPELVSGRRVQRPRR